MAKLGQDAVEEVSRRLSAGDTFTELRPAGKVRTEVTARRGEVEVLMYPPGQTQPLIAIRLDTDNALELATDILAAALVADASDEHPHLNPEDVPVSPELAARIRRGLEEAKRRSAAGDTPAEGETK